MSHYFKHTFLVTQLYRLGGLTRLLENTTRINALKQTEIYENPFHQFGRFVHFSNYTIFPFIRILSRWSHADTTKIATKNLNYFDTSKRSY